MTQIVVVGGYGNAGQPIVRLLLDHTDASVVVAGRNRPRAEQFVHQLGTERARAAHVDVTDATSLSSALRGADVLVVAAGTSADWRVSVEAALEAGCHQLDIQIGSAKNAGLQAMDARAREAGVSVITDCGFHPGVPAAMVRHMAAAEARLTKAIVSSWIAINWAELDDFSRSTVDEMLGEFADYRYEALVDGRWQAPRRMNPVTFPLPFGAQKTSAMGLDEMRAVAEEIPSLTDTGFYVGGFPAAVNYGVIPAIYLGMKVAPTWSRQRLGPLLVWGLQRFARPPYRTILQLDASAGPGSARPVLRLSHEDGYLITAAPVVATVRQLIAGPPRPGVHLQGMFVEPGPFFADLADMGIEVWDATSSPGSASSPA